MKKLLNWVVEALLTTLLVCFMVTSFVVILLTYGALLIFWELELLYAKIKRHF